MERDPSGSLSMVNPAHAGMILPRKRVNSEQVCKPRACGDDPQVSITRERDHV